ncbi:OmpA family protein [Actinomyces sp. Marseille-QA0893]
MSDTTSKRHFFHTATALTAMAALFSLSACSQSTPSTSTTTAATQAPEASATTATAVPAVAGYKPGEIPPIPLFKVPPIGVFASNADKAVIDATSKISSVPGVTVAPAVCDGSGLVTNGGNTVLGGDGSGVSNNGDKQVVNNGDGSGVINEGPVSIVVDGTGGGVYNDSSTGLNIVISADGSGTYNSNTLNIVISPDGSGTYNNSETGESIVISADGSGTYSNTKTSVNYNLDGKGAGVYTDPNLNIINNGDGTAQVNGQQVKADKAPTAGKVGKFPKVDSLKPVESCGTTITLEDGVLFDFGKSDIRPEAAATLKNLAEVLTNAKVPLAHIYGHTDSIGDDASNQTLSEERAAAVVSELKKDGVTATLDSQGFGESKPVAPNTNADGSDNPAGRQANRRVEIFIPAF